MVFTKLKKNKNFKVSCHIHQKGMPLKFYELARKTIHFHISL